MIEVRALQGGQTGAAVALLARGMRDNPVHLAAFGADPDRRRRSLEQMFATFFRVFSRQEPLCAVDGTTLVAVSGVAPAGTCQPSPGQRLRFLPGLLMMGAGTSRRVNTWLGIWAEHDPDEPHSHLGPLAVDATLQGRGIGTRVMGEYCARLDAAGQVGYLETDKPENVRFYERHGYTVTGEAAVLGVPNWFMLRRPTR